MTTSSSFKEGSVPGMRHHWLDRRPLAHSVRLSRRAVRPAKAAGEPRADSNSAAGIQNRGKSTGVSSSLSRKRRRGRVSPPRSR